MPNFYFRYCCEQTGKVNQFFGLYFADAEITIGTVYDVQLPSVTGCAVSIDVNEITNSEYPIYSDSFFLTEYSSCNAPNAPNLCAQRLITTQ